MTGGEANALWARTFVDELARAGVRDVCVAPGSRSTPLVLAFAVDGRFRLRVHLDERSAAFFALGVGKATGVPAAVLTTSGTATANVFPAVMEASLFETPLLVLTADRPHRLRDADANQAADQLRLYGPYVRDFFEVAPPAADGPALRHLRAVAVRAVASAAGAPAGPVHLNFPFDKPLEPGGTDDAALAPGRGSPGEAWVRGRADGAPYARVTPRRPRAADAELDALAERLAAARRPLIVAGPSPEPRALGRAVVDLSAAADVPVLADPLSGARFLASAAARVCGAYDLVLREPRVRARLAPDVVLRVGRSPSSTVLLEFLEDCGADSVVLDPSHRWKDHLAVATDVIRADAVDALGRLVDRLSRPPAREPGWSGLWAALDAEAARAVREAVSRDAFEGGIARGVVDAVPAGGVLFVSNSMPVRDLDAFGGVRADGVVALGNRGASGIDGIVSTALGVAAGAGKPIVALMGDVALVHDANGLLAAREPDVRVVFVVVNNDGGGIFHFLPIRAHEPHFTPLFATPHGVEPGRLAAVYGVRHERVAAADVAARVRSELEGGRGSVLLEVGSDRHENQRRRDAAVAAVRAAVGARLERTNQQGEPESVG